jgi:alkanesulfonate monooxygenase SsuD/methylene tetrahydromethanopterin reductase-like flavin-dependent oxidoreductase (luciferase family)
MLSVPRQGELLLEHSGFDSSILTGIRAHFQAYPHRGNLDRAASFVPEKVAEHLALIGPPADVRARLAEYRAAGVDIPVLGIASLRALYGPSAAQ